MQITLQGWKSAALNDATVLAMIDPGLAARTFKDVVHYDPDRIAKLSLQLAGSGGSPSVTALYEAQHELELARGAPKSVPVDYYDQRSRRALRHWYNMLKFSYPLLKHALQDCQ